MSAAWVKIYNAVRGHPKIVQAGDRAAWLFICGLCYSNEYLTDGFIAAHALPVVAPGVKAPERLAGHLVAAGLWHKVDGGWRVHEYLDVQQPAEKIRADKQRDAARKTRGVQRDSSRSPNGIHADSEKQEVEVEVEQPPPVSPASGGPNDLEEIGGGLKSGRQRQRQAAENALSALCSRWSLPEDGVRSALSAGASSEAAVRAHVAEWFPEESAA